MPDFSGIPETDGSLFEIENGVLDECLCFDSKYETVRIPSTVSELGKMAFNSCDPIKKLIIPGSVKKMESNSIDGLTGAEEIIFLPGVKAIADFAFITAGKRSLKRLFIPESVTEIGRYAIDGFEIHTQEGSYAAKFAKENDIDLVIYGNGTAAGSNGIKHETTTLEAFLDIIQEYLSTISTDFNNDLVEEINEDPFSACFLSGVVVYIMLKAGELKNKNAETVDPILAEVLKFAIDTDFWQKYLEMKPQPFSFISFLIFSKIILGENSDSKNNYNFIYQLACNFVGESNAENLDSALENICNEYPKYKNIFDSIVRLILIEIKKSKTVKRPDVKLRTDLG